MGFLEVLFLILVVLKVTGILAWSWVVVLIPIWISIVVYTIMYCLYRKVARKLGE